MQYKIVGISAGLTLIGFGTWFCFEPSFEPAIGFIGSIGTIATTYWPKRKQSYANQRKSGRVTFDYGNNNGRYVIGENELKFETAWSKASDISIHVYNDPPSIDSVGIAKGVSSIFQITDATLYDMSSRSRTAQEGEIVVMKNSFGNYAAIQVLDIKDQTRSDSSDELTFTYVINPNGYTNFA